MYFETCIKPVGNDMQGRFLPVILSEVKNLN